MFLLNFHSVGQSKKLSSDINLNNHLSKKALLDSICTKIWSTYHFNFGVNMYSGKEREFSNSQDNSKQVGFNNGSIKIDTSNNSIRFKYTGTMGSGGFAPYFQRTFYFKNFTTFDWKDDIDNKNIIKLVLYSSYDYDFEMGKPILEIERISGKGEEKDSGPDYDIQRYSEYALLFDKNNFSIKDIGSLSIWLNALLN
jgi:hypothetical protein